METHKIINLESYNSPVILQDQEIIQLNNTHPAIQVKLLPSMDSQDLLFNQDTILDIFIQSNGIVNLIHSCLTSVQLNINTFPINTFSLLEILAIHVLTTPMNIMEHAINIVLLVHIYPKL